MSGFGAFLLMSSLRSDICYCVTVFIWRGGLLQGGGGLGDWILNFKGGHTYL